MALDEQWLEEVVHRLLLTDRMPPLVVLDSPDDSPCVAVPAFLGRRIGLEPPGSTLAQGNIVLLFDFCFQAIPPFYPAKLVNIFSPPIPLIQHVCNVPVSLYHPRQ